MSSTVLPAVPVARRSLARADIEKGRTAVEGPAEALRAVFNTHIRSRAGCTITCTALQRLARGVGPGLVNWPCGGIGILVAAIWGPTAGVERCGIARRRCS